MILNFLDNKTKNCRENINALIRQGKESVAFDNVNWESKTWDVTKSTSFHFRGHKQRKIKLHFTQHGNGKDLGGAFDDYYADLIKALVRLRYEYNSQNPNNQMIFIRAFRYLYPHVKNINIENITQYHFDSAKEDLLKRESSSSAYGIAQRLEEMAKMFDENTLTKVFLNYKAGVKRVSKKVDLSVPESEEVLPENLVSEEVLKLIGALYQNIPKENKEDRLLICIASLLCVTGFRVGEILSLERQGVSLDSDGLSFIRYYPEKGKEGSKRYLSSLVVDLVSDILNEINDLTANKSVTAKMLCEYKESGDIIENKRFNDWYEKHLNEFKKRNSGIREIKYKNYPLIPDYILFKEVADLLDINRKSVSNILSKLGVEKINIENTVWVSFESLMQSLLKDHNIEDFNRVLKTNSGKEVLLENALCLAYHQEFHKQKGSNVFKIRAVGENQLRDFLGCRSVVKSVFDRYGLDNGYMVKSHQFRHYLNNILNEGGMSELAQAEWFGRKHIGDNAAYHHTTPQKLSREIRERILRGDLVGELSKLKDRIPVENQKAVIDSKISAVHIVDGGYCTHNFSQSPCYRHLNCDGCEDYYQPLDNIDKLKREVFNNQLENIDEEDFGADEWVEVNKIGLNKLRGGEND